jgi:N-sulfoglucosamine sulfohydrolase
VHNYEPDRWPAGNPETGYGNCDDSPSKEWIEREQGPFYAMAFGKRPEFELYRLADDPECVKNVAADAQFADVASGLRARLETMLRAEQDPRALGQAAVFDTYKYLGNRRDKGYDEYLKSSESKGKAVSESSRNQDRKGGKP